VQLVPARVEEHLVLADATEEHVGAGVGLPFGGRDFRGRRHDDEDVRPQLDQSSLGVLRSAASDRILLRVEVAE
jgi:hypothetical protein